LLRAAPRVPGVASNECEKDWSDVGPMKLN
jgi:hypothetical protein